MKKQLLSSEEIREAKKKSLEIVKVRKDKMVADYKKIHCWASNEVKKSKIKKYVNVDFTENKNHPLSTGERRIRNFLKRSQINFCREKEFDNLINPDTGMKLRLDFYLIDLNTAIEFDGKQHFQYTECFDKGDLTLLQKRQYLDNVKDLYCASNGIRMIRIAYWQLRNIKTILKTRIIG